MLLILGIVAIVVVGMNWDKLFGQQTPAPTPVGPTVPSIPAECPTTLQTAYDGDVINSLNSSSTEYMAAVHRFVPDGVFADGQPFTAGTSAAGGTAINLRCGSSYEIYLLQTQDAINSVPKINMGKVVGSDASRAIISTKTDLLDATAYDNVNKGFVYDSGDASNSDYEDFGMTWKSTTDNTTGYAMTTGSQLDWTLNVKTGTSASQFGNSDLGLYVAVDADKTDFDTPVIQIDGVTLQDVKGTGEVSADDEATLSAYEYIFKVPAGTQFQSTLRSLRVFVNAKSGQDPDVDVVLRVVGKGYYLTNDGRTVRADIFNKDTSTEIVTGTAQTATIDVT